MVCILGIVLWGYDVLTGSLTGRRLNIGAPALSDENFVAAHVVAFLPLVTWYALTEKGWVRWVCLLGAPLMVNIVAHSQSRGAVLAMGVAVMSTVLVSRRKMRAWAVAGTFVGALVALQLFNEQVFERLDTLATYQEDKSASGRIDAWRVAWQLTLRNPFGYGGEAFDVGLARPYMPSRFSTTHSMVFEVMVAWGVQGVFFIFGFILFSVRDAWRLYKASWDGVTWPPPRSTVIAVSVLTGLLSMLVAALFLNRYRWDLWWVFGGVIVCLKNIRAGEQAKATQQSQLESDEKAMIAPLVPSLRKPPAPGPQPPP